MNESQYDLRLAHQRFNELVQVTRRSRGTGRKRLARTLHRFADRLEN